MPESVIRWTSVILNRWLLTIRSHKGCFCSVVSDIQSSVGGINLTIKQLAPECAHVCHRRRPGWRFATRHACWSIIVYGPVCGVGCVSFKDVETYFMQCGCRVQRKIHNH